MVKPARKVKTAVLKTALLSSLPWACTHFGEESEIEAHVEATGKWETIADVHPFMGFDGEDIASFILRAVNNYEKTQTLFPKIKSLLDLCLQAETLPPKIKQKIDELLKVLPTQDEFMAD